MKKEELEKRIEELDVQIEQFRLRMKSSELCRDLYDNAILERAVLKKELDSLKEGKLKKILNKVLPHKEKLISDYFK